MAGRGTPFMKAGYTFPKPLIDVNGQTMIEVVIKNLKPHTPHKFIFVCQKEQYDKYDFHNILKNATDDNFEVVLINGPTQGAACTALCAISHINSDEELVIGNSDQFIDFDFTEFVESARTKNKDGLILTFKSSHPKWSYARTDESGKVLETAEKKVISDKATAGVYYFKKGSDFIKSTQDMIYKNIRHNDEFYICPTYNEIILNGGEVAIYNINSENVHGIGTPEDLDLFLKKIREGIVTIE